MAHPVCGTQHQSESHLDSELVHALLACRFVGMALLAWLGSQNECVDTAQFAWLYRK